MAEKELQKNGSASDIIAKLVLDGDLSKLTAAEKIEYYRRYCESLGLNPLTRPFQLIKFEGKLVMYPTKDCTEQLRKINEVSIIEITSAQTLPGLLVLTAKAKDKTGKVDVSTAAVALSKDEKEWKPNAQNPSEGKYVKTGKKIPLEGDELANALMKAETKAKRRVTLSICGLGAIEEMVAGLAGESFLDEKINPDEVVVTHEVIENPEKGDLVTSDKRNKVLSLFEPLGVLKGDLEEKMGKKFHFMTQPDYDSLAAIYKKIKGNQKEALANFRAEALVVIEIKEAPVVEEPITTQETIKEEPKKEEKPEEKKPLI